MRILVMIPPYIPSYFNAGHHLPIFQVSAYLRHSRPMDEIIAVDGAALNINWRDVCELLIKQFDVVMVMNDFDAIDGVGRFMDYVNEFCSETKTFTFGRLSNLIPGFFERFNFDGIACSGDYEASALEFINSVETGRSTSAGVSIRLLAGYSEPSTGKFLEAEEWVFPDVTEIPYSAYDRLYQRDLSKFCGIPDRRELVVPIARGCPVGCAYCDVPVMQGLKERRVSVAATLDYIESSLLHHPFEYVSFYAPTFTLRRHWVKELCDEIALRGLTFPWKCVTTTFHINEQLLSEMAAAGCIRVSVGLETLDLEAAESLPTIKRDSYDHFSNLAVASKRCGVELNCFVIVGLPGDTVSGLEHTIREVISKGCRVRPTVYAPYELLSADMSVGEVGAFNRQTFISREGRSPEEINRMYKLLYQNSADISTNVMSQISVKRIDSAIIN